MNGLSILFSMSCSYQRENMFEDDLMSTGDASYKNVFGRPKKQAKYSNNE